MKFLTIMIQPHISKKQPPKNLILVYLQVAKANSLSEEEVKGLLKLGKITRVNITKVTKEVTQEVTKPMEEDNVITLE